jgi:1,4-alpha-glucan branching enzyme
MQERAVKNRLDQPWSVYEVHLGSWSRDPESPDTLLNYREIAVALVSYVKEMNFTHVEFMPLMEHPYYPSWGYQITGYFAASSRYGSAQDLMYLIEELHAAGIGVLLDWVPSHFQVMHMVFIVLMARAYTSMKIPGKAFIPIGNPTFLTMGEMKCVLF